MGGHCAGIDGSTGFDLDIFFSCIEIHRWIDFFLFIVVFGSMGVMWISFHFRNLMGVISSWFN